jgi:hypothetical protein
MAEHLILATEAGGIMSLPHWETHATPSSGQWMRANSGRQGLLGFVMEAIKDWKDDNVLAYLEKKVRKKLTMPRLIEMAKKVVEVASERGEGIIKPTREENRKKPCMCAWLCRNWREHRECFDKVLQMMIVCDGSVCEVQSEEVKVPCLEEMEYESCGSSPREELLPEDRDTPYAKEMPFEERDDTSTEAENIFSRGLLASDFDDDLLDFFEERKLG